MAISQSVRVSVAAAASRRYFGWPARLQFQRNPLRDGHGVGDARRGGSERHQTLAIFPNGIKGIFLADNQAGDGDAMLARVAAMSGLCWSANAWPHPGTGCAGSSAPSLP